MKIINHALINNERVLTSRHFSYDYGEADTVFQVYKRNLERIIVANAASFSCFERKTITNAINFIQRAQVDSCLFHC
jgi:hypothetical protein